ncbi:MAG: hypothetical protein HY814_05995 [Candidatus Riflebacteria bacterium]|nr:hypothetical protein [Candidatus Riflebacteria bacterium]
MGPIGYRCEECGYSCGEARCFDCGTALVLDLDSVICPGCQKRLHELHCKQCKLPVGEVGSLGENPL